MSLIFWAEPRRDVVVTSQLSIFLNLSALNWKLGKLEKMASQGRAIRAAGCSLALGYKTLYKPTSSAINKN